MATSGSERRPQSVGVRWLVPLSVALCIPLVPVASASEPVPLPPPPQRPGAESGATTISVDAWFADISNIDSAAQTFSANLALVLRWHDPSLIRPEDGAATKTYALADVWHPRWLIVNEGDSVRHSLPETVDVAPDGSAVYRQRLLGSFSQALDLRRFPFDRASFRVHLVLPGHRPGEIQFVPDEAAVAAGMPMAVGLADAVTLPDWRITAVTAQTQPYVAGPAVALAGYAIEFTADRRVQHYLLTVMFPLVLIVLMSWAVFWIDPSQVAPQISVSITSMLTLIAYRFAIGADVPSLPYLTLLDTFILASSLLVLLSLVEVLITTTLALRDRIEAGRALDRHARWLFPSVFVIVSGIIFAP
jgi:hypothetical protein